MTASGIMILPSSPVIRRAADRDPAGGEIPVKRWSQPLSKEVARCAWGSSVEYKCRNNQKRNLDNRCHRDRSCGKLRKGVPVYVLSRKTPDRIIGYSQALPGNQLNERDISPVVRKSHCFFYCADRNSRKLFGKHVQQFFQGKVELLK